MWETRCVAGLVRYSWPLFLAGVVGSSHTHTRAHTPRTVTVTCTLFLAGALSSTLVDYSHPLFLCVERRVATSHIFRFLSFVLFFFSHQLCEMVEALSKVIRIRPSLFFSSSIFFSFISFLLFLKIFEKAVDWIVERYAGSHTVVAASSSCAYVHLGFTVWRLVSARLLAGWLAVSLSVCLSVCLLKRD